MINTPRITNELHQYSKEDIEHMTKTFAKMAIIGSLYTGEFISQIVHWEKDGGCSVITKHRRDSTY